MISLHGVELKIGMKVRFAPHGEIWELKAVNPAGDKLPVVSAYNEKTNRTLLFLARNIFSIVESA